MRTLTSLATATILAVGLCAPGRASADPIYAQVNLTADIAGPAANVDANLIDPWGIAFSPTSPFWIADKGTSLSTLYNGAGLAQALVVSIPAIAGAPTGTVFNGSAAAFGGDRFIFATDNGSIAGWSSGTNAQTRVLSIGGNYTGLAIGGGFLYAANFDTNGIDVYDTNYAPTTLAGNFVDPNLPAGYHVFNIQNIGGLLYVTYTKADVNGKPLDAAGNGYVDVFDLNGNFVRRLVSNGALNGPWGLALAPATFGGFGGALLVGNTSNGLINAFDSSTGVFLGVLSDLNGQALVNDNLHGLAFGNGGAGFDPNALYFTSAPTGTEGGSHGLFGRIDTEGGTSTVPEPTALSLLGVALVAVRASVKRRRAARLEATR